MKTDKEMCNTFLSNIIKDFNNGINLEIYNYYGSIRKKNIEQLILMHPTNAEFKIVVKFNKQYEIEKLILQDNCGFFPLNFNVTNINKGQELIEILNNKFNEESIKIGKYCLLIKKNKLEKVFYELYNNKHQKDSEPSQLNYIQNSTKVQISTQKKYEEKKETITKIEKSIDNTKKKYMDVEEFLKKSQQEQKKIIQEHKVKYSDIIKAINDIKDIKLDKESQERIINHFKKSSKKNNNRVAKYLLNNSKYIEKAFADTQEYIKKTNNKIRCK